MSSDQDNPVALTGIGWVTPFTAGNIETILQAVTPTPPANGYWSVEDVVAGAEIPLPKEISRDAGASLAALALTLACRDASLDLSEVDHEHLGLVLGCSLAGQLGMIDFAGDVREHSPRFVSPIRFPQTVGNYVAGALARGFDIRGPNVTLAGGYASGLDALLEGASLINSGSATMVIAGGFEVLQPALASGLQQPGPPPSEGACMFVLESMSSAAARGAAPLAVISPEVESTSLESTVGFLQAGGIAIEHLIGRSPGPAGAAAVAAAIGALRGLAVPFVDAKKTDTIEVRPLADEKKQHVSAYARVSAMREGGGITSLVLALP